MKRRILSIICALALCLTLLPATALAEEEYDFTLDPGSLDFGTISLASNPSKPVTITNTGTKDIIVRLKSSEFPYYFVIYQGSGFELIIDWSAALTYYQATVAPGDSVTVSIQVDYTKLTDSESKHYSETIYIPVYQEDGSTLIKKEFTAEFDWVMVEPDMEVSETALDLGTVGEGYGDTQPVSFTITNSGQLKLDSVSCDLLFEDDLPYEKQWWITNYFKLDPNIFIPEIGGIDREFLSLDVGASKTIGVYVKQGLPQGTYTATLQVQGYNYDAAKYTYAYIPLTFTVGTAQYNISAAPNSLDFGTAGLSNTQAAARTVTITNTGNTVDTITLPSADNFEITAGDGFSGNTAKISQGRTASFTVQPKAGLSVDDYSGTLTLSGSGGSEISLNVSYVVEMGQAAVTAAPQANSLTYTGSAQALVTAGTATGGDMMYRLGDSGEFSADIPTGTNAGEYTVYYYVQGDEDHNDTALAGPVTVTISKADPKVTAPVPVTGLTYTGEEHALIMAGETDGGTLVYSLDEDGEYTDTIPTGIDVGSYTVYYYVQGNDNYNGTEVQSVTVAIGNELAKVTAAPAAVTGLTYDGESHALVTAGAAKGGEMQYSIDGSSYSATIPTGTDAGEYTVYYKVAGDDNHSDTQPAAITVTIARASINEATVTIANTTYTGSIQMPNITVSLDGRPLKAGTDYTVTYTDADGQNVAPVDAGTYSVTVTGKGNYTGECSASDFTITPAKISIRSATLAEKTYDGTTAAVVTSVTFDGVPSGQNLTLGTDYTAAAVFDTADAGTDKTATVTVTLINGNYTFADGKTTAEYSLENQTIQKANYDGIKTASGYVKADTQSSVTLPDIPTGASYGDASYSGSSLSDLSVSDDGVLSYTGGSGIVEDSQYTVTVQVNGGTNYNDYDITVTLTGTDKAIVDITGVTAQNGTYNGAAQMGYTGTPAAGDYTGPFDVTYNVSDTQAPVNAGSYTVTITVPDSAEVVGSLTLAFTIEKAAVTVTAPSKTIYVGDAIPEVDSLGTASVSGLVSPDDFSDVTLAYGVTPDSSQAGTYAIVPSGGTFSTGSADNYTVQYVNGTLTIQEPSTPVVPEDPAVPSTPDTSHSDDDDDDDDDGYSVSVPASSSIQGGSISVSPRRADKGDTVTITVKPDDGYVLETLTVTTRAGAELDLTKKNSTQYTFTMPAGAISVQVSFVPEAQAAEMDFADVAERYWAYDEIAWAWESGYMNGTSATTFNPGGTVSRQQVWMILARMAGADPADMAAAKVWAVANGISDGTNPGGAVTRQQLATLLYRCAVQFGYDVSVGEDTNILSYTDAAQLSEYAVPAMQWACGAGIINGTGDGSTLSPQGTATRAQLAVMLYRWLA